VKDGRRAKTVRSADDRSLREVGFRQEQRRQDLQAQDAWKPKNAKWQAQRRQQQNQQFQRERQQLRNKQNDQ